MDIHNKFLTITVICACSLIPVHLYGQPEDLTDTIAGIPVNYDERLVEDYILPDLFTLEQGGTVSSPDEWITQRRPEILNAFTDQ